MIYTNPILRLPLERVLRPEIAIVLAQMYGLHTLGSLLSAWRDPRNREVIEKMFDTPQQAHHAVATFACWLSAGLPLALMSVREWWPKPAAGDAAPLRAA